MQGKMKISFYKEHDGIKNDKTWMLIDGLDESALHLFSLPPEQRNAEIKKIMEQRGVEIAVERKVAEEIKEDIRYPREEISGEKGKDWTKRVNMLSDKNKMIGDMCENMYRRISARMAEIHDFVTYGDLRIWFPSEISFIETLEQEIDQQDEPEKVRVLCDRIMDNYDKVFAMGMAKCNELTQNRDQIFRDVLGDQMASIVAKRDLKETSPVQQIDFDDFDVAEAPSGKPTGTVDASDFL